MKDVPVFMAHGTQDTVVKYEFGTMSRDKLKEIGCNVTFKDYPMAHSASDAELKAVAEFIGSVLPPK